MIKRIFIITLVLFGINFTIDSSYASQFVPDEEINITVYEKINPAIVSIDAELDDGISAGTGCIVSSDGMILTGSHVVNGFTSVDNMRAC